MEFTPKQNERNFKTNTIKEKLSHGLKWSLYSIMDLLKALISRTVQNSNSSFKALTSSPYFIAREKFRNYERKMIHDERWNRKLNIKQEKPQFWKVLVNFSNNQESRKSVP